MSEKERRVMSLMGHKQTCALQKAISTLPPNSTAKADIRERSCLLYPRERTCAAHTLMSALGRCAEFQIFGRAFHRQIFEKLFWAAVAKGISNNIIARPLTGTFVKLAPGPN